MVKTYRDEAMQLNRRAAGLGVSANLLTTSAARPQAAFDAGEVVHGAADALREHYVDAGEAARIADHLLARLATGAYATRSANTLAQRLTRDLRAETRDAHMSVRYEPPGRREGRVLLAEDDLEFPDFAWGMQTAARLPGNIGLLRTTHFPGGRLPQFAPRCAAAMTLLQDTRALIVDLTNHHGGGTDANGYFMSYFIEGQVELHRVVYRDGAVEIIATSAQIEGPRYGAARPIFVAISSITFSAGESVASELRERCGAALIGARTRGGGNAGNFVNLPYGFRMFVVMGRGEDVPWEGVGLAPDIETPPERAVATAYRLALQTLIERETDPVRTEVLRNVAAREVENLSSFDFRFRTSRPPA
jgi:C-terminal processing protease CtpA/Prc